MFSRSVGQTLARSARPECMSAVNSAVQYGRFCARKLSSSPLARTSELAYRRHLCGLSLPALTSYDPGRSSRTQLTSNRRLSQTPYLRTNMTTQESELQIANLFDVKDKVALVTGGATGIGLMAAQALSYNGAKVYIVGRRQEKLDAAMKHHSPSGPGEIIAIQGDISSKDGLEKLVSTIESKEKALHFLINNAGINTGATSPDKSKDATEMKNALWKETGEKDPEAASFQAWTDTYRTNVAAMYFTTVAFLPLLEAGSKTTKGFSSGVTIISSMSGITKQSQGGMFSYNSSKGAAIHLNEMLATELANNKIKIRVNSIAPGFFPSEMSTKSSDETGKSHVSKEKGEGTCPADRYGNDKDMANAILFCSTNQYLNGVTIPVDGGWLLTH